MKLGPEEKRIMDKMQPGILTVDGFLGNDNRNLHDIIQEDAEKVEALGYTAEDIGKRMQYLTERSKEAYEEPILIDQKYLVQQDIWRGKVVRPFPHNGLYVKADIHLKNIENGIEISWTPLNIHFIEEHGFFEGKGSKHRLDPETLIKAIY